MNTELIADARCTLGEGITWDEATGRFLWVDIHGRQVWSRCLATGQTQSWRSPQRVGWLIRTRSGTGWVAGLQEGMAQVSLGDDGQLQVQAWLARPFEGRPSLRLNDAKADAAGRIWAGSLNNDDESRPEGEFFCLQPDGRCHRVDDGYGVANGPAIHPSGHWMLHTDSARKTIYAFDINAEGELGPRRVWLKLGADEGYPDGMNFDAEGCLWLAHWGAGCVSRYSGDGTLMARVALPVSQVTNVAFGGPALDRLWVTSARVGLSEAQLQAEPLAGGVFEVSGHGCRGLPALPCAHG